MVARRPSFVFIMTDTQATNALGCYPHPALGGSAIREELRTPRLNQLAAEGVLFERAYTTCPLCTPARAGLFTGRYPHTAGAWTNNQALAGNVRHLGQRFRDQGYRTAYSGKWHLDGHDYFGTGECPDGWDDDFWYDGMRYQQDLTDQERALWRGGGLRTIAALREHDIRPEMTWAHRVSDRAIEFLRQAARQPEQPFVFVASYDEPHGPHTCPPEYAAAFADYRYPIGPAAADDLRHKPRYQQEWAASGGPRRGSVSEDGTNKPLYFGCNSFVDSEIGRVMDAVAEYMPQDTWIIYTSDHGDMLGAHRLQSKACAVYEEIAHIPLLVRPPRGAAADGFGGGRRVPTLASHIDVLPTMLDLAGVPVPPALEGESLVPQLRGESGNPVRSVFVEYHRFAAQGDASGGFFPMRAIVKGSYKLAINLHDTDELYDRSGDPAEVHNRIEDPALAETRDALHDELLDWMYANRDPFRSPAWERRPWRSSHRLSFDGGWSGRRRGRDDGYAAPYTQENYTLLSREGPPLSS